MRSPETVGASNIPLYAVVTTDELRTRPSRTPNFEAENGALQELAQAFAATPQSILQTLADTALTLCNAHSAGISMLELENGEPVSRLRVLAGQLASHFGKTLPRSFSPCGTVLDRNAPQLMTRPVRHFSYLEAFSPSIEEALLVPFHVNREPVGTIFVIAHDAARRFDSEDARLLTNLGRFAAAGYEALHALQGPGIETIEPVSPTLAADRRKGRFMAILGHELRGHLAPAKSAIELLNTQTLGVAQTRWAGGVIERHVDEMTRLVDGILDVACLTTGNLRVQRSTVAVADIIAQSAETVRPAMTARAHEFVITVPPEPIFIDADSLWLAHALQNLLGNAAKCTHEGGRIGYSVHADRNEVVFTVSDTGIGIEPGQLDEIFGLYVQGGPSQGRHSAGEGHGIGLYLVRLVVEAHGGTVRAISAGPGSGSQFIVRMPRSRASVPPHAVPAASTAAGLGRPHAVPAPSTTGRSRAPASPSG